jgi:glycosyltransferase involved in cell wall biosynthesis
MRVLYFSEALVPPFDEGIKKTARHLLREIQKPHEVLALTNRGPGIPEAGVRLVLANRLLAGVGLWRTVRRFRPERVLYLPTACATLFSFIRARLLALYARKPVAMIALQPRHYGRLARLTIPLLRAGPVWAQGQATAESLRSLGCDVRILPPAVDADRFMPADAAVRKALRGKYGIAEDAYVVLHVGHILPNRNVPILCALQAQPNTQVIVVGSTAFGAEGTLVRTLRDAGVILLDHYLERVEEVYQLADCYVFPVQSALGSIEVPLSVLEAMACNLPVASAPFGDLPRLFPEGDGVRYFQTEQELIFAVQWVRQAGPVNTRSRVLPYTWETAAQLLVSGAQP